MKRPSMKFFYCVWFSSVIFGLAAGAAPMAAQTFTVTPTELSFAVEAGSTEVASRVLQLETNPPGQPFTAQVQAGIVNPAWLSISPTSGATPAAVTVSVNPAGLTTPGSQTVNLEIRLTEAGFGRIVPVSLTVTQPGMAPRIGTAPSSLNFTVGTAGDLPPQQQLAISNANTGSGTLSYSLSVEYPAGGPQDWLQVTPNSGSSTDQPSNHQVQVTTTQGFPSLSASANIVISGGASNSPQIVPVTLTMATGPLLSIEPPALSFFAPQGGAAPPPQTLTLGNEGAGSLAYQIEGNQPWLSIEPQQGDASTQQVMHQVSVNPAGLQAGTYEAVLTVLSDALPDPKLIRVSLAVGPPSSLFVQPTSLDFVGNVGIALHERRTINISSFPADPGGWTARVVPASATWLQLSSSTGRFPGKLFVGVDTAGVGAGELEAEVEIVFGDAPAASQSSASVRVPVRLTAVTNPPVLAVRPTSLLFEIAAAATNAQRQVLTVDNLGGPRLDWTAAVETDDGGGWLSISPPTGTAPTLTQVFIDPSGLEPGVWHGRIRITAGPQVAVVPVTAVVSSQGPRIELEHSGFYWETAVGRASLPEANLRILSPGTAGASWSAQATRFLGAEGWLGLAQPNGTVEAGSASDVAIALNPSALNQGEYAALVEVRGPGAPGPRYATGSLRILASGQTPPITMSPGGLSFTAVGPEIAPQTVRLHRNQTGQRSFLAGTAALDGGDWLRVSPEQGATDSNGAAEIAVEVNHDGLEPGVYRGSVTVSFGEGVVESAPVALFVPAANCLTTGLVLVPKQPYTGFRARPGRAMHIEAELLDNCGAPVNGAAVTASFNNGDAAIVLTPIGQGRFAGDWTPRGPGFQTNVMLTGASGGLHDRQAVVGAVTGPDVAAINRGGVVNAGGFRGGEALSPGAIVSIFGRSFAQQNAAADSLPLPGELGGLSVLFAPVSPAGTGEMPLFFSGTAQVNAQIPFSAEPAGTGQFIVRRGNVYSTPEKTAIAAARPGIFSEVSQAGIERAIAHNQDQSINSPVNPASRGEAIVVYLSGVGPVDQPVEAGAAPPAEEPFARATLDAEAKLGDVDVPIFFLGMTPGFAGLAQANLIIPANAPTGINVPLTISIGGQRSNTVAVSIQGAQ